MRYYLSIGSNIGNKLINLQKSIEMIYSLDDIKLLNVSDFIVTKPWGNTQQDDFLNAIIEIDSSLEPELLLQECQAIEISMGREKNIKWGPRLIDIDIVFWIKDNVNMLYESLNLIIPHQYMHTREFVLKPLCQLKPDLLHPKFNKTVRELYNSLKLSEIINKEDLKYDK
ncbi:MAG: 2-amino-4-hydroxy-6-hydroxymethyldihydropteridine diphosphokinase [Candidatus Cloacimonetes bacterium]|jgi:2-amino-4-hydroxy-6-hydroxymethyldihydropteridine diphosphokinase|nr:2-amino-4-hydroxy-6-hydroxymethyldihydropteridine diphosphokinase [Candidatus Cloacimonadota bacterium]MDD4156688.1 2-amino-4-hydroxy-6-hydroxymethyldihydropteridine diphosphokinase [Candidatus Cloacimonadota bacterium]